MAPRPLDRLTSIRAKLGSTVVIAVALALAISYVLIAFALRNSPRDSEAIDALSLARQVATGRIDAPPPDTMIVIRHPDGSTETRGTRLGELPRLQVDTPRWGVIGAHVFATVPTSGRRLGHRADPIAVARVPRSALGDDRVPAERLVAVPPRRRRGRDGVAGRGSVDGARDDATPP